MSYDLFIFAGENSGDLHGEKLLRSLYAQDPNLKISGVGGPKMRSVGMDCFMKMEEFEVMGFIDILPSLPKLIRHLQKIKKEILSARPKAVIFIDYPGFNLRLARALKKNGSTAKRIHYICPTVWAWGQHRIPKMEKTLDQLLTILPFESKFFSQKKMQVDYVGHPLISRINNHNYDKNWRKKYGINHKQQVLSIFPGSREKEILRNFPIQIKVAKKIQKNHPNLLIAVSCSNKKFLNFLTQEVLIIDKNHAYELMRGSHMAIATSGTVTLELALHYIPTVVTFAIRPIDVFIAQNIFRINLQYYSLPNIIENQSIFPEFFGPNLNEESLYKKGIEFIVNEHKRSLCIEQCDGLKKSLGTQNASQESARTILDLIGANKKLN